MAENATGQTKTPVRRPCAGRRTGESSAERVPAHEHQRLEN
ncbi:hypothetical protein B005_2740 [Nocardiopsis alba ATCC BAA-2165]|uniref:Uncharacterized protein n=1 Tax=Nocardiopsis alba (strain ATCC BAA-2165 / BE74) TaxID=1205910 RepID=J7L687_NOCAA|nr:hypothetical protein B005_2740 [Nocardiopsis alba ATCC BAA-2165]